MTERKSNSRFKNLVKILENKKGGVMLGGIYEGDADLYYTTDGSEPDTIGNIYRGC